MENIEKKQAAYKETLIAEYLELLLKTESDPEKLKRFSDQVWLQEVTVENLHVLIRSKKDLLDASTKFYEKYKPKE